MAVGSQYLQHSAQVGCRSLERGVGEAAAACPTPATLSLHSFITTQCLPSSPQLKANRPKEEDGKTELN